MGAVEVPIDFGFLDEVSFNSLSLHFQNNGVEPPVIPRMGADMPVVLNGRIEMVRSLQMEVYVPEQDVARVRNLYQSWLNTRQN